MGTASRTSGGRGVEFRCERANGGEVGRFAAEGRDDLNRRAEGGKRINLQNFERLHALQSAVGVFLEKRIEDGTGFGAVFSEDVSLLHFFGALFSGERRRVEGKVADEVEGVVVTPHLFGEFV